MRLFNQGRISLLDVVVACLSGIAYAVALFSTAIGGFWTGPDFEYSPSSGLDCLQQGWLFFPIGWLANPVLFVAVVLLLARCRIAAFLMAIVAIALAWLWNNQFCREFSPELLRPGFHWWLSSMQILIAGSFCSLLLHCSETWRSLKSLGRACRRTFTSVQENG